METNKAKEYAEGKAVDALTVMIEQAYNDGYKAGYEDGLANQEPAVDETDEDIEIVEQGVKYVDLGLPSGTLWSPEYYGHNYRYATDRKIPYIEAIKLNIPTEEQFKELEIICRQEKLTNASNRVYGIRYTGRNGNHIDLLFTTIRGYDDSPNDTFFFWLRAKEDLNSDLRTCARRNIIDKQFMGYQMPLMLVKK